METKFRAFPNNNPLELAPFSEIMHIFSNKWVFKMKYKAGGTLDKFKAKLVAKRFQQTTRVDFFETYSSIVKAFTIRVIFTLAVTYGWGI